MRLDHPMRHLGLLTASISMCLGGCKQNAVGRGPAPVDAAVAIPPTMLRIEPPDVLLLVPDGEMPVVSFTVIASGLSGDQEVTSSAQLSLENQKLGKMTANVFSPAPDQAGATTLGATYTTPGGFTLTAQAKIRTKHYADFTSLCPGCPTVPDPGTGMMCAGKPPQIVYPTDNVLFPPNMSQLEVHFLPGTSGDIFEVDFENTTTDIRIQTRCSDVSDTHSMATGGCALALTDQMWNTIVQYNKGGEPLTIAVRASRTPDCSAQSLVNPSISFAEQDLVGVIYYWKSQIGQVTGGDIWRKNFGDKKPEEKITGAQQGFTCSGCHSLSRDGLRMTINMDDNDSDDEYGDVSSGLMDLKTKMLIPNMNNWGCRQVPGFHTFNHDHTYYLGSIGYPSNGFGNVRNIVNGNCVAQSMPATELYLASGETAALAKNFDVAAAMMGSRPTHPDWSIDDKSVVYVVAQKLGGMGNGFSRSDDTHVFGGSLFRMTYLGGGKFGPPESLIASKGENNYYPSYSPDGKFVLFDRVPADNKLGAIDACTQGDCPNDSFSNPRARVMLLPVMQGGAATIDLERLNGSPHAKPVPLSNSWPRWSPFVQRYKGSLLLWVTFSSTRDYGLRVRNHQMVNGQPMKQCYPPGSPENANFGGRYDDTCQSPQLWMAAINLTAAGEFQQFGDPSFPAFWIPFQDIATHNHTAQWTATTGSMGGPCIKEGMDCTGAPGDCCTPLSCLGDGTCGMVVM